MVFIAFFVCTITYFMPTLNTHISFSTEFQKRSPVLHAHALVLAFSFPAPVYAMLFKFAVFFF